MNTTATAESIPTTWIDERDVPFFRITDSLFDPEFVLGATVLLASYDTDNDPAASPTASASASASEPTSAASDVRVAGFAG